MPEYSLSSDFDNKLNRDQLFTIISTNTLFTAALNQILVTNDVVNIVFDQPLTENEQTYLNNIVSNYVYDTKETSSQQRYAMTSISFDASPNTTTTYTKIFKNNISIINGQICVTSNMIGDSIRMCVTPDKTVGVLTVNAAIGADEFTVSPTVVQNVILGLMLTLSDGVNTNECGQIIGFNTANNTIKAEIPTTNSFLASTPTYVKITAQFIDIELGMSGFLDIASRKIDLVVLPKNYPMTFYYTNRSLVETKRVVAYIEHFVTN